MFKDISPDELANNELAKIKKKYGKIDFPIDPFKLLKDNEVIVSFGNFDNLEGIIINDNDNVNIVGVNQNRPWTRQRFTAAHEYCHYIKDIRKEKNDISKIECFRDSNSRIERYANKFASCLLMPSFKVKELYKQYKNDKGYIDFESVTRIAEFFGVSFSSCIYRLISFGYIDGKTDNQSINKRITAYKPDKKRKEFINNNNDFLLIGNAINSLTYCMIDINSNTGSKFLNNYIYHDNRIEGVNEKNVSYILADLNYNKEKSSFLKSKDEGIVLTLGNYLMQEYVLTTNDNFSIYECKKLHKILYSYAPFPEFGGKFRDDDAVLLEDTIQPISYLEIEKEMKLLNDEFNFFLQSINNYSISEYIERVVYFIYRFIKIHPFSDGNGRVSRAMLNWMLRLKRIPPIYVDISCKQEYLSSLSKIDLENDYIPFIIFVERRIIQTLSELHDYLFLDE